MKWNFLVILMIMTQSITQAQDTGMRRWMPMQNRIGLALGIGTVTYLDKNTSPLIYRGKPKNLRLFYNLESDRFLFSLDLDVKVGGNAPKYHPGRTLFFQERNIEGASEDKKFPAGGSFLSGYLSLGAYYKIPSTQASTFKVAVGARVMNELFYPQGWTSSGMFNALSISPEAWVQHRVNEHHAFTAGARLPVAALLARLPYDNTVSTPDKTPAGGFLDKSRWTGPGKFLAPAISLGYQYQFNDRWGAGLNYDFSWYQIRQPQTMKAMNHSFLANFYHQF